MVALAQSVLLYLPYIITFVDWKQPTIPVTLIYVLLHCMHCQLLVKMAFVPVYVSYRGLLIVVSICISKVPVLAYQPSNVILYKYVTGDNQYSMLPIQQTVSGIDIWQVMVLRGGSCPFTTYSTSFIITLQYKNLNLVLVSSTHPLHLILSTPLIVVLTSSVVIVGGALILYCSMGQQVMVMLLSCWMVGLLNCIVMDERAGLYWGLCRDVEYDELQERVSVADMRHSLPPRQWLGLRTLLTTIESLPATTNYMTLTLISTKYLLTMVLAPTDTTVVFQLSMTQLGGAIVTYLMILLLILVLLYYIIV